MNKRLYLILILLLMTTTGLYAQSEVLAESGSARVGLMELYTSEGYNSCPPAEAWHGSYMQDANLWVQIVPLAFHVDYWDKLGWKDVFAKSEYSKRQRDNAKAWGNGQVYTPMFVFNGVEWRGWFDGDTVRNWRRHAGELTMVQTSQLIVLTYKPLYSETEAMIGNLALVGCGASVDVTAGENKGNVLDHDFVVINLKENRMNAAESIRRCSFPLPNIKSRDFQRYALAAWVHYVDSPAPLQCTGCWYDSDIAD